jgi:hypothetical protein
LAAATAFCCETVRFDPGAAEEVVDVLDPELVTGAVELVVVELVVPVLLLFLDELATAATMAITTKARTQYRFLPNRPTTNPSFVNRSTEPTPIGPAITL